MWWKRVNEFLEVIVQCEDLVIVILNAYALEVVHHFADEVSEAMS